MCLITQKFFPRIALRNIPIYKEVTTSFYSLKDTNDYYSLIRQSFIGKRNSFPIIQVPDSKFKFSCKARFGLRIVEGGFIHCYKRINWASHYSKLLIGYIPRGTFYYQSSNEYAARKIIYTGEYDNSSVL